VPGTTAPASAAHKGLPRLLAGVGAGGELMSLAEHEHIHGPLPRVGAPELIEAVSRSGLRGRGGADFPTGHKLRAVAGRRRVSAVVVNATETEPASRKDALLLSRVAHLVLDGAVLAAGAVGAGEVIVRVSERSSGVRRTLQAALAQRRDGVPVRVSAGPPGYVTGEENAVINALNGGPPLPRFVPPRPYQRGLRNRPTLIQNPETLAQLALIARFGPEWFRELGTAADPGSVLVTISGAVTAPGVYELAFGTPMSDLLAAAGGPRESLQALLIGGYFGTWLQAGRAMELRLAREELRSVGCSLGSGVIIALGRRACGLSETARVVAYLAEQSAGQCGPCVHGLRAIADGVAALHAGAAPAGELVRLQRWAAEVKGRGACHHPDGAARLTESALAVFAAEVQRHRGGRCGGVPAGLPLGDPPQITGGKRP
jgi:NADH:ubiquinone oxidoreductase subunit F (NADH-binding)